MFPEPTVLSASDVKEGGILLLSSSSGQIFTNLGLQLNYSSSVISSLARFRNVVLRPEGGETMLKGIAAQNMSTSLQQRLRHHWVGNKRRGSRYAHGNAMWGLAGCSHDGRDVHRCHGDCR